MASHVRHAITSWRAAEVALDDMALTKSDHPYAPPPGECVWQDGARVQEEV